jgi:hypothetical protein
MKMFLLRLTGMVLLGAAAAAPAAAQAAIDKVPRPVYFAPAQVDPSMGKESAALIGGTPEMLATSIAALQSFDRVDAVGRARSVVTVTSGVSGGAVTVTIQLLESGAVKTRASQAFAAASIELAAFRSFIDDTAARLAPSMDPVTPEADLLKVSSQKEMVQAVKETDYLDQLDKRWEFTLWMSGLLRMADSTGVDSQARRAYFGLDILPLIAEADWFFGRNLGLQFSFYFNDTSAFDFGHDSRYNAYGLFLFPGIGLIYRTLGEISAEYAITFSAGWIYLSATSGDVVDQNSNVVLAKGSSTWSRLAGRIRISPALLWSITPAVALKAGIGFDIVFPGMFPWYGDSPLADFQYLCLGAAYKM